MRRERSRAAAAVDRAGLTGLDFARGRADGFKDTRGLQGEADVSAGRGGSMRTSGLFLVALAVLCLAVVLPNAIAAEPLHSKKGEIGKEKREEDEREDATDREIVERELAAELPGEEQFDNEQREALSGKPAGEEKAPEAELLAFRQSVVAGGTHVKVRVNPHGSFTRVLMYLDWAKKCNTQVNCPTKGKYTHETAAWAPCPPAPKTSRASSKSANARSAST